MEISKNFPRIDRIVTSNYPNAEMYTADSNGLIDELRRVHSILSKIAWHRGDVGSPDVPVLQERYDTLLAERERLQGVAERYKAERDHYRARIFTTPKRRLREHKGVTYDDGAWVVDGTCYYSAAAAVNYEKQLTDADHAALMQLKTDAEKSSAELLCDIIIEWRDTVPDMAALHGGEALFRLCDAIEAAFPQLQHPQPVSDANKFVGSTVTITPEQMAADLASGKTTHTRETQKVETLKDAFKAARTAWFEESTAAEGYVTFICTRLRAWFATQPSTITPEQAVSVLVEGGAKLEQVTYRATIGSTHMTAGTRILILPIATPGVAIERLHT